LSVTARTDTEMWGQDRKQNALTLLQHTQ